LDRVVLIEFLALALLINAAAILLVLRARRSSYPDGGHPSATGPPAPPASLPSAAAIDAVVSPSAVVPTTQQPLIGVFGPPSGDRGRWSANAITEWSDRIRTETARCQRYGRPAAIVAMRLDGLDALAADAGTAVGAWLCRVSARNLRELARVSDLVQSDGLGSFRALLVETDETGARTYVERISRLLVPWPDDPRAEVRLIAGWAGTWSQPDLEASDRLAHARMVGSSEGWIRSVAAWRSSQP
jgi:GGDEF domain-containing protein